MRIQLTATAEDHRIAYLAALAIGLSLVEAAVPSPLPGVKPGLANIVTLVVLTRYGWRVAAWVSILRVVAGSILLGTFLSPSFILSLTGAASALLVLALTRGLPKALFGPVSHSIVAAFAHVAGQLAVVYLWLIPHAGLAYLLPVFAAAALFFGTVNGLVAAALLARIGSVPRRADATV
jgi:heptaprenyl diphosphate synthase